MKHLLSLFLGVEKVWAFMMAFPENRSEFRFRLTFRSLQWNVKYIIAGGRKKI